MIKHDLMHYLEPLHIAQSIRKHVDAVYAMVSLFMPAHLGLLFFNHFGYIHLLNLLTLYAVPTGYFYRKKGNVNDHKRSKLCCIAVGYFCGHICGYAGSVITDKERAL
ncbi:hypothetical protein [Shewanella algicola]|uniref:hypothetical protein n=1 Tax=Shewanella algicola TaxID=640633 RepID=UPI002493F49F|nr:hypothetical protein [Shewanella algicola]